MPTHLSEDEKNALLAIHEHLECLRQSGFPHASIAVEQVLVLLRLPGAHMERVYVALATAAEAIKQKPASAAWHLGVIIRDLERLTANIQHGQQYPPDTVEAPLHGVRR